MSLVNINGFSPAMMSGAQLNKTKGIEGARAFQTGMNSTVAIFDENEDVFYIKTTDSFGNIMSLRKFNFTEEVQLTPIDSRYVTVDQFEKFKDELKEDITNAVKSVQQSSNNSKSYGKPKQSIGTNQPAVQSDQRS